MKKLFFTILFTGLLISATNKTQAAVVDLTVTASSGSINDAIFVQGWAGVTGTGVLDSFVRIQVGGTEQGYNTDNAVLPWNTKNGLFTHSLRLDEVSTVAYNNTIYREFMLGMGQNNDLLSLDQIQIYLNNLSGSVTGTDLTSLGTLIYNLDAGEDSLIKLNHSDSGNGRADMTMYILDSLFTGSNPYVYLYSQFGTTYSTNDGPEEWGVREDVTHASTPEPTSLTLLGLGLLGLTSLGKRRTK